MTDVNAVLVAIGGLVLLLGLVSGYIHRRLPLSNPFLAMMVGVVIGPPGLGLLDPAQWGPRDVILKEAARLTLAIGLMATALRLPPRYFAEQWRLQAILLGVLMPLMWAVTAALIHWWLGIPVVAALLLGAILTPTDPIVASSIVTGGLAKKLLPERVRHALSGESGANDGLAYGLFAWPLFLLTQPDTAHTSWLVTALLHGIGGAIALGLATGAAAGWLLMWGERRGLLEESSFLAFTVALALLVLGLAGLVGTSGILAVFVAGLAFDNRVGGKERAEEAQVQEAVNQFFTLPVFALVGLAVPVDAWLALEWRGVGLVATVLILRRLPATLAVERWISPPLRRGDALFVGWFGPIGVSAVLYASEAAHRTGNDDLWGVASLVISGSIAAHGITATPLTRLYANHARR